jgi:hypothetical protein
MAKIEQMLRLKYIEEFLRRRKLSGASYQEITNYLEEKLEDRELKFTERTFQRDKKAILDIFKVEILYSRSKSVTTLKKKILKKTRRMYLINYFWWKLTEKLKTTQKLCF